MTTSDSPVSQELQDFQDLLRDLFQFDVADLDFGVYRILNEKRDDIERFIEEDLVEGVREELEAYEAGKTEDLREELEEKKSEIRAALGEDALLPDGSISEAYEGTPLAKEYRDLQDDLEAASLSVETERRIYDDLARFFNRYYDSGDFVTKRRFAAGDSKYYVPYDGEEVLLHWANRDQYYVKTTEHFKNYRFEVQDYKVEFELVDADVPHDNVKENESRHFVLCGEDAVTVEHEAQKCTITLAYRAITEDEKDTIVERYNEEAGESKSRLKRRMLCTTLEARVLDRIENPTLEALLSEPKNEAAEHGRLYSHLNRYTAKNTADYFVHKDLGGFLRGQLEFFIQNEVLQLDDVLEASEQRRTHQVNRAKVVKKIGERIIDFLVQIENFQKRLFEKKKFVVDTGYCATLDRVPDTLYDDILKNDDQLDEWRDIYSVDEWDNGLFSQGYEDGTFTREFLEAHPHVMIDTRHFDRSFVDTLLEHFSSLSDEGISGVVEGLCIQGENFQAMDLLRGRYEGDVEAVYADPPYNTSATEILYKNGFRHSTWLSLMEDRVKALEDLQADDSIACITIDDYERDRLRNVLNQAYGEGNYLATAVIRNNPSGRATVQGFSVNHEYGLFYAKDESKCTIGRLPHTEDQIDRYDEVDEEGDRFEWENFRKNSAESDRADRPKQFYPLCVDQELEDVRVPKVGWNNKKNRWVICEEVEENEEVVWPIDTEGTEKVWLYGIERAREEVGTMKAKLRNGKIEIYKRKYLTEEGVLPRTWWDDAKYSARDHGTRRLKELFGPDAEFDFPKAVDAVADSLRVCSLRQGDTALDPFAGSGTTGEAVLSLFRDEPAQAEYVLVEMGDYFDTVMLPRLKKVALAQEWSGGVPKNRSGISHVMQYHRLESYEDSLNNIKVKRPETELDLMDRFDDYALHYMLPTETRESDTLLAPEAFEKPFDYTLRIQHGMESPTIREVDLESTFNYLIGLEVGTRRVYQHQVRRYVVVTGQVERQQSIEEVMVVWRDREDLDLDEEKEWAADTLPDGPFDTVYVNGPSHIHGKAEPTEIVFRERMDPAAG